MDAAKLSQRLLPRITKPLVVVGLIIAVVTLTATWSIQNRMQQQELRGHASVVMSALEASAAYSSSAHGLTMFVRDIGKRTTGLMDLVLIDQNSGEVLAATRDAWVGRRYQLVPQLEGAAKNDNWHWQDDHVHGFSEMLELRDHGIARLAGREVRALVLLDGTQLAEYHAEILMWLALLALLAGMGMYTAFFVQLRGKVIGPIHSIERALQTHDAGGALKLPILQDDELGHLAEVLADSMKKQSEISDDLLVKTKAIEGGSNEVYVIDATSLTILSANRTALEHLGCREDQAVGQHIDRFAPEMRNNPELVQKLTADIVAYGRANYTYDHERLDGSLYPFEFKSMLVTYGQKAVLVVIGDDITARVKQSEALRMNEERLQLALQGSTDGLFDLDLTNGQIFISDLVKEWFGVDVNETTLDGFYAGIDSSYRDVAENALKKAIKDGGDLNLEYEIKLPGCAERWVQARGQFHYEGDRAVRLSGFISDITSRKVAQNMLSASVSRLGAVLDHIADGIMTLSASGTICTVNPAVTRMFRQNQQAMLDSPATEFLKLEDSSVDLNWDELCDNQVHEVKAIGHAGIEFTAEIAASRMEAIGDERYTLVVRDITERKQHEMEIRSAMEEAQAATRAKGEFLATMSHEIRTPMNGVLGMTQLLLDMDLSSHQKETAETILSSAESLLTLINDILDFSKIEAGKLELEHLPFDLRLAVKEVLDLVSANARRKSLDLYVDYPADLPYAFEGDVGRIRQVLLNLVGNAVKFTGHGHVLVKIGCEEQDTTGIKVSVSDTGPGIHADVQARLFESFTQADASTTRRFGGTGLGLAICQQLVELMGGEIGINSEPGNGSEFWFRLPLVVSEQEDLLPTVVDERLAGKRMLVVDDNHIGLHIAREMARSFGMQARGLQDPHAVEQELEDALRAGESFDVVALDYNMPGLDGLTLATNLRGNDTLSDLKIVMLTSSDIPAPQGLDGYALKPLMRDGLHRLLSKALFNTEVPSDQVMPESADMPELSGVRVLLAEDNPVNQRVAVRMLENMGCRVDVAANGREAIQMWQQFSYAMIFMDCQMPEVDGLEATRQIRKAEVLSDRGHIPIVAMTANAMNQDQEDCLQAGMDDYASKPVKKALLQSMVVRWSNPQAGEHTVH